MTVVVLILLLGTIFLLRTSFTIISVDGDSMYPTFKPGDRLFSFNFWPRRWLRKGQIITAYSDRLPIEGSPISFTFPKSLAKDLELEDWELLEEVELSLKSEHSKVVKRIVGLPGDTIQVSLASLHEFSQTVLKSQCNECGDLVWNVPPKHLFIRGDGLLSTDSLTYGPISFRAVATIILFRLPSRPEINMMEIIPTALDTLPLEMNSEK